MAVNLAEKYSSAIDEVFKNGSLTQSIASQNKTEFIGAQTVKVYSMDTAELNDYKTSGANRYGTPEELGDSVQEMTLSRKRSFTYTIDATHAADSPEGVRDAAKSLRRQIDERVIPELDGYRLAAAAKGAGFSEFYAPSKATIVSTLLSITAKIDNSEVPETGRIFYAAPSVINLLKSTDELLKTGEATKALINGAVGEIDGMAVVKTPTSRLPVGAWGIIIHPHAIVAPVKLAEYKVHENPPGIAGSLVEGLVYYGCFVLNNKKNAVAVGYNSFDITMTGSKVNPIKGFPAGTFVYKAGASVTAPKFGDDISSWTALPADGTTTAASGNKVCVAVRSADGKCVTFSNVVTVA